MPGRFEMHRDLGADMNPSPLRLVVDRGDGSPETAFELPHEPTTLAIHLHMGESTAPAAPVIAAPVIPLPSGKSKVRPFWLGFAGIVATLVAFETGAHIATNHAQDLQAAQTAEQRTAAMDRGLPYPPSASGALSAALQQQLRQPPIVTPPPGATAQAGAPDPFGLHP
jgi:hypothetical protein